MSVRRRHCLYKQLIPLVLPNRNYRRPYKIQNHQLSGPAFPLSSLALFLWSALEPSIGWFAERDIPAVGWESASEGEFAIRWSRAFSAIALQQQRSKKKWGKVRREWHLRRSASARGFIGIWLLSMSLPDKGIKWKRVANEYTVLPRMVKG